MCKVFQRPTHPPQQGLEASSVGCWPPPWWPRSLPQLRVALSLEWGGGQRHIGRSRRSADGEPPCKLDGQMHNVKTPKWFRRSDWFLSCHATAMMSDLYERARSHWGSASGTPLGGENCTLQPRREQSAQRRRLDLHHFSPAGGKRCDPYACDSPQAKMFNELRWPFYTLTSTITSKSVPNIGVTCLIDSFKFWGCAWSLVGSMVWCPAFL